MFIKLPNLYVLRNSITSVSLICLVSSIFGCNNGHVVREIQNKQNTELKTNSANDKSTDSIQSVNLGYYETYEKLPKLNFTIITESEFNKLKSIKYLEDLILVDKNNGFLIQTKSKTHSFDKYSYDNKKNDKVGYEFLGYYPQLKLFAISEISSSEGLGFSELILLDSLSDFKYRIISFGDAAVELPIPSANNNYLVYYYNQVYEHSACNIGVLKINDKSSPNSYLSELTSFESNQFAVESIIWKTDNCFYLMGFEELYENNKWVKKYSYYKTLIL